jgi:hypothetical protein
MIDITIVEMAGLIGVVLVISTGKVFNPLREFLRSFEHPYNPFPWVAGLISCSMCSGVWIGVIWGLIHSWSWGAIVVFSGLLSLSSYVTNEVLGVMGRLSGSRAMRGQHFIQGPQQSAALALTEARARARKRVAPGNDISEEEADALIDQETERADLLAMPPKSEEVV